MVRGANGRRARWKVALMEAHEGQKGRGARRRSGLAQRSAATHRARLIARGVAPAAGFHPRTKTETRRTGRWSTATVTGYAKIMSDIHGSQHDMSMYMSSTIDRGMTV